jgi:Fic family protein
MPPPGPRLLTASKLLRMGPVTPSGARSGALRVQEMGSGQFGSTVSTWFLKRRDEYQDRLLEVSCTGDWNPWIQFFCRAVCEQSASLINGTDKLVAWLYRSRDLIIQKRWTGAIHKLLEDLTEWPVISISFAATRYNVTTMTATRMVNHLVEVEILRELTGRNYGRVFGAHEVIETVDLI